MTAPTRFRAGDSASWSVRLPAYPHVDGWALSYRLLSPAGGAPVSIAAAAGTELDTYTVTLAGTDTAAFPVGAASLVAVVTRGPDRHTLGVQAISIAPDLTTATTHDARSQARRALEDARAALAAHMASGRMHVQAYAIAGRQMTFRSVQELRDLIAYWEAEVAKETAAQAAINGHASGRILTRM